MIRRKQAFVARRPYRFEENADRRLFGLSAVLSKIPDDAQRSPAALATLGLRRNHFDKLLVHLLKGVAIEGRAPLHNNFD